MALIDKLTAIAEGFRSSRGTTEKLSLDEMAQLAAVLAESVPDGTAVTFGSDLTGDTANVPFGVTVFNGIMLPSIPTEALALCPYYFIDVSADGSYTLYMADKALYKDNISNALILKYDNARYRKYIISDNAWVLKVSLGDQALTINIPFTNIAFTSHDIPKGSQTATAIYMNASPTPIVGTADGPNYVPAEREEKYAITSEDLNALGYAVQKLSNDYSLLTVSQMAAEIDAIPSESYIFAVNNGGYLTIPTEFMAGNNPWTVAFTIDNRSVSDNAFSRVARGSNDVPSIFYKKSTGFMFKLGRSTVNAASLAWYDTDFLAPYTEGGALIFGFPGNEKTTFVFLNDGDYISLWVNGEMKAKQEASVYTSDYYASTFSIGDNAMVGSDMVHMECSMLKAWNRALTAEEIAAL